jgi:hypothetical protein
MPSGTVRGPYASINTIFDPLSFRWTLPFRLWRGQFEQHLKDIGDSLGKAPEVLETFLAMLTELLGTFFLLCLEM